MAAGARGERGRRRAPVHRRSRTCGEWRREAEDVEAVFHLGLPRLDPPLRRTGRAPRAPGRPPTRPPRWPIVAGGRPVVMLSSAFAYGDRRDPAADGDPVDRARRRRRRRARRRGGPRARGAADRPRALGARPGRHGARPGGRACASAATASSGAGDNLWAMLGRRGRRGRAGRGARRPARGLQRRRGGRSRPRSRWSRAVCAVPGHRRPDRVPPRLAALVDGRGDERGARDVAGRPHRPARRPRVGAARATGATTITRLAEAPLPAPGVSGDGPTRPPALAVLQVEGVALQVAVDADPDRQHAPCAPGPAAAARAGRGGSGRAPPSTAKSLALRPLLAVHVDADRRLRSRRQGDRVDGGVGRHGRRTLPHR